MRYNYQDTEQNVAHIPSLLEDIRINARPMIILEPDSKKINLDAEPEEGKIKELIHLYDQFQLAEKKLNWQKNML